MRILFINQYYAPDFAATAQLLSDLCAALVARGHEVHVLCSQSIYDGRKMELAAEELLDGVHVHRLDIGPDRRTRYRERLQGYLAFLRRAFSRAHSLPKFDVVVTLTTPPFVSMIGVWLRLIKGSRFVYWVMDIYPDIALRAGILSRFGPTRILWSTLGRLSRLGANAVVVLGQSMRETMAAKGVSSTKLSVLPCWSGGDEVRHVPRAENRFRNSHFREDDFVVMYSGNAGTCHHFQSVIDAIRALSGEDRLRFAFIGGGKRFPQLQSELSGAGNVLFMPYQPREMLAESLSSAGAHLVTLEPAYDGLLYPSKIYGAMAVERPIVFVGSAESDIARLLRETGCGVSVPVGDAVALASAMRHLASNPEECAAMGKRGGEYFRAHFDRPIVTERFALMLESLARAGAPEPHGIAATKQASNKP